MNKEVLQIIEQMWNEIDPCHVCPFENNITDEYELTAKKTYHMFECGYNVHDVTRETMIAIACDMKTASELVDLKVLQQRLKRIKIAYF